MVCVLAAPEGIAPARAQRLPVRLVTASIDEGLNDNAYIVPGLGDAGDRQFGPALDPARGRRTVVPAKVANVIPAEAAGAGES